MQVNVYSDNGATLERRNVYLGDVCGDDREEMARARNELEKAGRYWIGGGAAPLFLLMRCVLTTRT